MEEHDVSLNTLSGGHRFRQRILSLKHLTTMLSLNTLSGGHRFRLSGICARKRPIPGGSLNTLSGGHRFRHQNNKPDRKQEEIKTS